MIFRYYIPEDNDGKIPMSAVVFTYGQLREMNVHVKGMLEILVCILEWRVMIDSDNAYIIPREEHIRDSN